MPDEPLALWRGELEHAADPAMFDAKTRHDQETGTERRRAAG